MGSFYLYSIENNINNKMYIGITNDIVKRWSAHRRASKRKPITVIQSAIKKYGTENFNWNIAEIFGTKEEALEAEKFWIRYLRDFGVLLYNVTDGGEGTFGHKYSTESLSKRSATWQRTKPTSGDKHYLRAPGVIHPWTGNHHSTESKKKCQDNCSSRILKETEVIKIRQLYSTGDYTHRELGLMFNVKRKTVGDIIHYKTWKNIP